MGLIYITPTFAIAVFALVGLCIGSFLNVVIYRLPKILETQFDDAMKQADESAKEKSTKETTVAPLSLSHPPSSCGACGHRICWYENIPVLSFIFLRGRCAACQTKISWRYPIVEAACSVIFAYAAWRWHFSFAAVSYALFGATLLTLAMIDWDTTYLPDDLTVPLTWAGLIAAGLGLLQSVSLSQSLAGAVAGYLSLWLVFWAFKLITGRDGMGYGDFKLFAAIGAWLGWQALIPVILVAASLGSVIGIVMKVRQQEREGGYVPFGPFLAFGALLELVTGWQL